VPAPLPPALLNQLAPGWSATLAYGLVPEVTTWRLTHPDGRVRFAKIDTLGEYPTLEEEAERMVWAAAYLPVPEVVALERIDHSTVLLTEALPGGEGAEERWRADPEGMVRAFGAGLAAFHEAIGEERCPFRFDNDSALAHVHRRVAAGLVDADRHFDHEFAHLTVPGALQLLEESIPDREDLVVCHGDYCPPNVMIIEGKVTGYVDLGELGAADRWRDIAIGTWSTGWSFGPEFERYFYDGYGIEPDPDRVRFYRLLWAFSS
jgi:kanamycin kinase